MIECPTKVSLPLNGPGFAPRLPARVTCSLSDLTAGSGWDRILASTTVAFLSGVCSGPLRPWPDV